MSVGQQHARLIAILLAGFVFHAAFGRSLRVGAAMPNLALCVLLVVCLFVGTNTGAALGFLTGLLEGAYAALYLGSFLVSRSLIGFAVGALEERIFRRNPSVAVAIVLLGTAATEGCFFLFAPQPNVPAWAFRTLYESLYNAALALPLYLLVRRLIRTRKAV